MFVSDMFTVLERAGVCERRREDRSTAAAIVIYIYIYIYIYTYIYIYIKEIR